MKHTEIREKIKSFMSSKNFAFVESSSLVPDNDPSVLFTTAGVQPLVPYIKGEKHPLGNRISNIQKCIRTQDIEEIGDNTHDTFFEMIGYWYLGKESASEYTSIKQAGVQTSYNLYFTSSGFNFDIKKAYITCFGGNEFVPKDEETASYWMELGVPSERILFLKENWWSTGAIGPCGPDSEIFYSITSEDLGDLTLEQFLQADQDQKIVEVGNTVFMLHNKTNDSLEDLAQQNVDFGGGLERVVMASQGVSCVFDTDLFLPAYSFLQEKSKEQNIRAIRIVSDHLRTSVLILSEGVVPSNTAQGYVLRRLIRRLYRFADMLGITVDDLNTAIIKIFDIYESTYNLASQKEFIQTELTKEIEKFKKTLVSGLKNFEKMILQDALSSKDIFNLYTTYGFPLELTYELLDEKKIIYNKEEIEKEIDQHKQSSKTAAAGMFKGGLAGNSEIETRYHTATHILHTVLRNMFGTQLEQKGSNINTDRMRFDFSFDRALTPEEIKHVEDEVNRIISLNLPVIRHDVSYQEAQKMNAIGLFGDKYGEVVSVYQVGADTSLFSTEICMGPHVTSTQTLGTFQIQKEESSSAGVRRIKAVLK
jgi:alanyl-tRNA synthetase